MRIEQDRSPGSTLADLPVLSSRAGRALLCVVTLLPTLLVWGCSGLVSGQNASTTQPPPPQTYSISGTISPVTGGNGATVALSGAAAASTTADGTGNYSFTGLANGTYAVAPSRTGYTFNPSTQAAAVSGANVTGVNFAATAQTPHSVALTWSGSTSTVSGYNVYRSTVSGAVYAKINASLVAVLSFTDSTVLNSTTYYYVTTAVDSSGNESAFSNEVQASIP
jgi:hypothetical protein